MHHCLEKEEMKSFSAQEVDHHGDRIRQKMIINTITKAQKKGKKVDIREKSRGDAVGRGPMTTGIASESEGRARKSKVSTKKHSIFYSFFKIILHIFLQYKFFFFKY